MTHDELLARISRTDFFIEKYPLREALRAVVELHSPRESGPFEYCFECDGWDEEDGTEYPCPTIEAIEKELR